MEAVFLILFIMMLVFVVAFFYDFKTPLYKSDVMERGNKQHTHVVNPDITIPTLPVSPDEHQKTLLELSDEKVATEKPKRVTRKKRVVNVKTAVFVETTEPIKEPAKQKKPKAAPKTKK